MQTYVDQAPDVVRVAPNELAETIYIVHKAATDHLGNIIAQNDFQRLNADAAPCDTTVTNALMNNVTKAMQNIIQQSIEPLDESSAACFLTHEVYRTAHQLALTHNTDPVMCDVYDLLLTNADHIAQRLKPTDPYHKALEKSRAWYEQKTHTKPDKPCQFMRRAAKTWPTPTYELHVEG